jgi:hypothetical protein
MLMGLAALLTAAAAAAGAASGPPPMRGYTVVLAPAASPADHFAANELAGLLGNFTNGHLPLPVTVISRGR